MPAEFEVRWYASRPEAAAGLVEAEIAWVDLPTSALTAELIGAVGPGVRWLNTIFAGVESFPLRTLAANGTRLTNGVGVNAAAVADYAALGVLAAAKRFDQVVRAADRRNWLLDAPGKIEPAHTAALIIGYGAIGRAIGERLAGFGVAIIGVTRSGRDGTLTPEAWRARLGAFDWIILAAPSTIDTTAMIGATELAAMRRTAWIVNVARGDMIDQPALITALNEGRIGGAFLDVTEPEPLPPGHPLWSTPNAIITMHLSGRSQTSSLRRSTELFLRNLAAYRSGAPMTNLVDLTRGY